MFNLLSLSVQNYCIIKKSLHKSVFDYQSFQIFLVRIFQNESLYLLPNIITNFDDLHVTFLHSEFIDVEISLLLLRNVSLRIIIACWENISQSFPLNPWIHRFHCYCKYHSRWQRYKLKIPLRYINDIVIF